MEHIAPLLQTILWVGLIGGIVLRFHKPIFNLLTTLEKRISAGSTVKAGPFEISDQLKPQDSTAQIKKAEEEVYEVLQLPSPSPAQPPVTEVASVQAIYYQAEDLVLRALQTEYGVTISRQVTAGADQGFDGAFVKNGEFHIVEVKYLRGQRRIAPLRGTIERLADVIGRYGWRKVRIILAVVFEDANDVAAGKERLLDLASKSSVPVDVRCYAWDDLRRQFGLPAPTAS